MLTFRICPITLTQSLPCVQIGYIVGTGLSTETGNGITAYAYS
jgi:hypothetical protein